MILSLSSRSHLSQCVFVGIFFIALTAVRLGKAQTEFREDQILIKPKSEISKNALRQIHSTLNGEVVRTFANVGQIQVVRVPKDETVASLITKYQQSGLVEFAEPDYLFHANLSPNDPRFTDGTLWWLNNTGQNGGTTDADVHALPSWDILNTASNIIVAVVDSGIRTSHEDLTNNMWVNPSDGSHGFNAITGGHDPEDDNSHGTLVAGMLGAEANNNKGMAGIAWHLPIMACKFTTNNPQGNAVGSDSSLIACFEFARMNGARIVNLSYDSDGYSEALSNAIITLRDAGIILVVSAGNGPPTVNIDTSPRYPSCYQIDNIISVAASTRNDGLFTLSNYGATNVDLAAPGDQMYSTYSSSDSSYYPPFSFYNIGGTSFSAPLVAGACALVWEKYPVENYQQIIQRVLNGVDPLPALAGKCVTGGRLNLQKALGPALELSVLQTSNRPPFQLRLAGVPHRTAIIEMATNLNATWSPVFTNQISINGNFDFTDAQSTNFSQRFYRGKIAQ